jgi:hypothetical protein
MKTARLSLDSDYYYLFEVECKFNQHVSITDLEFTCIFHLYEIILSRLILRVPIWELRHMELFE